MVNYSSIDILQSLSLMMKINRQTFKFPYPIILVWQTRTRTSSHTWGLCIKIHILPLSGSKQPLLLFTAKCLYFNVIAMFNFDSMCWCTEPKHNCPVTYRLHCTCVPFLPCSLFILCQLVNEIQFLASNRKSLPGVGFIIPGVSIPGWDLFNPWMVSHSG